MKFGATVRVIKFSFAKWGECCKVFHPNLKHIHITYQPLGQYMSFKALFNLLYFHSNPNWLKPLVAFFHISSKWLLQNFAPYTTAALPWHVQTYVEIWWRVLEVQQYEFSIELELWPVKLTVKRTQGFGRQCDGFKSFVDWFFLHSFNDSN